MEDGVFDPYGSLVEWSGHEADCYPRSLVVGEEAFDLGG